MEAAIAAVGASDTDMLDALDDLVRALRREWYAIHGPHLADGAGPCVGLSALRQPGS